MTFTEDLFKQMLVQDGEKDNDSEKQSRPRYEILSAADALQPQPPIEWIVDGLISAGSVNLFYGEGGSKKTWVLLDMGVCVARGEPWLNFKTQAGPILFIDEESGQRRMMRRLSDVLSGHNAVSDTPIYCVSLAAFDFGEPNDIGEFYNLINSTKVQLVIIDALADVMPGKDENSVKDVQPIFLALRGIVEETQAAIIIIHHANKSGDYRGSSAMKGAVDLLLKIKSKTGSNEIIFNIEKARDITSSSFVATANFALDSFSLTASIISTHQPFNKGQRYVLLYLLANGASAVKNISDNADTCSETAARNGVYELIDSGSIKRINGGGRGVAAIVELTEKGKNDAEKL